MRISPRALAMLMTLVALLLAGCSGGFSAGNDDDNDGEPDVSGGGEVNTDDDNDNDSPGAGVWAGLVVLALAGFVARRK